MNKKQLIAGLTIRICFSLILLSGCTKSEVPSEVKTYPVDLNNDGRKEVIQIERLMAKVLSPDKIKLGEFKINDYNDRIEFVDLNKNGHKQIVLWTKGEAGYAKTLVIYSLKNNRLFEVFKIDTNSEIITYFEFRPARIKAGSAAWAWNGEQFIAQ